MKSFSIKKTYKRIISLIIVLLFCINSFAAVVSDNDGSAFITKAEFDSLKNDFQSTIDQYNASIDSKIDSSIASYLAGITTSKTTIREPYISNYDEIMWQPNYKVYGEYRKWTNNTTSTQSSGKVWFTPSLNEKRQAFRGDYWYVYDHMEMAMGEMAMYFYFNISRMTDGMTVGAGGYAGNPGHEQACPTLTLKLTKDNSSQIWYIGEVSTQPVYNMNVLTYDTYSNAHTVTKISGPRNIYEWSAFRLQAQLAGAPVFQTPGAGEYLKYRITIENNSGGEDSTYESVMKSDNTTFPWQWFGSKSAFIDCGWGANSKASMTTNTNLIDSTWFSTGCTWHHLDNATQNTQVDLLRNMQLGSNYDQDVNIAKPIIEKSEGFGYDKSAATEFATMTCNLSRDLLTNPLYANGSFTSGYYTHSGTVTVKVPHWPTEKLRQQTSNKFFYGDKPLKLGQGMPLFIRSNQTGDVQVTFDYKINYLLNSTDYTSAQDLYIDLKRGDFLDKSTTTSNFYEAYSDIVQSGKTTEAKYRYKDYKYPTKTGKVKMTIPIEKGESIWFRMRPANESGGYYAKMSNLEVKLVTE